MYNNIQRKQDGTFIVNFKGMPFQITPEYPAAEQYGDGMTFDAVKTYAESHPSEVAEYVEPVIEIPEPTMEDKISALEKEASGYTNSIQAGIDVDYNQQKLINVMLEIESLRGDI